MFYGDDLPPNSEDVKERLLQMQKAYVNAVKTIDELTRMMREKRESSTD